MSKKRAPGEGTIHHDLKRDRWQGKMILPNGKRRSVYGKNQREVQRKLAELRREVEDGIHATNGGEQTVRAFALKYLAYRKNSPIRSNTIAKYETIVRLHFDQGIGETLLHKLTPEQLQTHYSKKMEGGLSSTSVTRIHNFIHIMLKNAVRLGIIPRNPSDYVDAPGQRNSEQFPLSAEQLQMMRVAVDGHRFEAAYITCAYTGLREGELLGLKWEDIDFERRRVVISTTLHRNTQVGYFLEETKNRSSLRTLPLPSLAIEAILKQKAKQRAWRDMMGEAWGNTWDLVFTTEAGEPIHYSVFLRQFQRALKAHGLPEKTRVHDLRHTFATLLLEEGVHLKVVSMLLGHASVELTLRTYGHVTPRMTDGAIIALEKLGKGTVVNGTIVSKDGEHEGQNAEFCAHCPTHCPPEQVSS